MEPAPAGQPSAETPDQFAARAHRLHRNRIRKIVLVLAVLVGLLLTGVAGVVWFGVSSYLDAQREREFTVQLRATGRAAHGFASVYQHFPPITPKMYGDNAIAVPLSFQTAILPHMGYQGLYNSLDMTIPWNDPANTNYQQTVPIYLSPHSDLERTESRHGATFIVPSSRMVKDGVGLQFADISDGTSNTVLAGEIDETLIPAWGDPNNARDPAKGYAGGANAFGSAGGGPPQILLGDGSVQTINSDIDPQVAKALATPAAGDTVGDY